MQTQENIPSQARLVIVGAGIVGCTAAYHFAKLGWKEVIVLDKGELQEVDGSTSHAPGGMFLTNSSKMMTEFAKYSQDLLKTLTHPEGPTLFQVGGIEVAYTRDRWNDLHRKRGFAKAYGLESYLISPAEVKQLVPILDDSKIFGAYYVKRDSVCKSVRTCEALRKLASEIGGVKFFGNTPVTDLDIKDGRIVALVTPQGKIDCEQVLWCTNIWGDLVSRKAGLQIPLMAAEHILTYTDPLPELKGETEELRHPLMRHQDHSMYYRQRYDSYGVGSYRHIPLMVWPKDVGKSAKRAFTPEHFASGWDSSVELLPALKNRTLVEKFNGMFAFTVDGFPVMGESKVKGLWACTGLWLTHAAGATNAIANWMTYGDPGLDLREADITRFQPHYYSNTYIEARCAQNYREVYDIIHPSDQITNPRNVKLSPVHSRLVQQGAAFFQGAGWENPQWYEANGRLLSRYETRIPKRFNWEARNWSPIQGIEHLHVREHVGMFNLAALAIIEVSGAGAAAYLNRIFANQVDRAVGKIVYTAALNEQGGIVMDVTVLRRATDKFWVTTGGAILPHDMAWMQKHLPSDGSVTLTDLSSNYFKMGLWGPKARAVLQAVCDDDVSNEAFPYYSTKQLTINAVPTYALRVSYAGELGWELYVPQEYAVRLWDTLWQAGQAHEIIAAGSGAFDSLRLEKGYRLWGADIHTDYNPYEAGLGWAVSMKKPDFIGKAALVKAQAEGLHKKLVCMVMDHYSMALGKEPIMHDGKAVGYVSSANFGYSLGKFICYGYVPIELATPGTELSIEYFGKPQRAVVSDEPLFDAKMTRLKT
ncbi:MAG: FAD-dependent oxidoreductase [Anaerolineae bacterium]|nr:FAD-dependent oxidoreductase [Anaerolineae bacterium]